MLRPSFLGSNAALLTLLAAGAAVTAFACAKPAQEEAKRAWACDSVEVPMGEVVRCTSSALIAETRYGTSTPAPTEEATPCDLGAEGCDSTTESTGGAGSTYECDAGEVDCPPVGTVGESGDGTTGGGASGAEGSSSTDVGTEGATSSSSGGGGSGDDGTGGASSGGTTSGSSSGGSTDVGTQGGSGTPEECAYVPELDYCGGGSGASDGSDCTKQNCDAPGQTKGGSGGASSGNGGASSSGSNAGTQGGTSSSSGSSGGSSSGASSGSSGGSSSGASSGSSGGGAGGGRHYKCKKDAGGNATCESTPSCVPGTHPAPCGACVPDGDDGTDCVPPSEGGCWVTGGGFIEAASLTPAAPADGHDNFGGNAKPMKGGAVKGHWNHVDHGTGNHAKGRPAYIYCRHVDEPGPGQPGGKKGFTMNQVYFGGPAEWRSGDVWSSGYWFDVVAKDHGEPGSHPHPKNGGMPDTYHFTIRKMDDPALKVSGAIVYETKGELSGGNVQMHPPNGGHPATQSTLPAWVALED
ncbi:MAG: hypothetical protein KC657_03790 [Myxococcales bacterium]|nr:hypothetical protein [Myxococcales bacterium]